MFVYQDQTRKNIFSSISRKTWIFIGGVIFIVLLLLVVSFWFPSSKNTPLKQETISPIAPPEESAVEPLSQT